MREGEKGNCKSCIIIENWKRGNREHLGKVSPFHSPYTALSVSTVLPMEKIHLRGLS